MGLSVLFSWPHLGRAGRRRLSRTRRVLCHGRNMRDGERNTDLLRAYFHCPMFRSYYQLDSIEIPGYRLPHSIYQASVHLPACNRLSAHRADCPASPTRLLAVESTLHTLLPMQPPFELPILSLGLVVGGSGSFGRCRKFYCF